jgi:hypothetical protein
VPCLQRIKEEGLKLRIKKYVFRLHEMEHLGYTIIFGRKLFVSLKKVEV